MSEKELRGLFVQRLYLEYMLFKDSMLQREKKDIFHDSYKIEIFVNLYEILLSYAENLNNSTIRELLKLNFGILEYLYQKWQYRKDSFYEELRDYACGELEAVLEKDNVDGRKDDGDGEEESDQAA